MRPNVQFLIILSIFCTVSIEAFAKPTIDEFRQEMIEHKQRVKANALKIYEKFEHFFPNLAALEPELRDKFMKVYLSTHDGPKIMSLEQLNQLGYRGQDTMLEKLYLNWGVALKRRPPFIQMLNTLEDYYKKQVLTTNFSHVDRRIVTKILKEVEWLEFVADETDAKVKRGPELGAEMKPFDAYHMFMEFYQDPKAAEVSKWLEMTIYKRANMIFCEEHFRSGAK